MIATSGSLKMQHFLNKLMKRQTLGPIVMDVCELIKVCEPNRFEEIRLKQRKLSEVTDMIHAAHVFHRTVRNITPHKQLQDQDSVLSLLVGDYLLAQSSVDMASLRYPRTVGLVARGLEDYTKGEFLKLHLLEKRKQQRLSRNASALSEQEDEAFHIGIRNYAELTCGSLLSNACLSALHLSGHMEETDELGALVQSFGHNTGSAQRLIEILNYPSEDDKVILDSISSKLEQYIKSYLDKSVSALHRLPDGRTRPTLLSMLDKMRRYLIKT